MRHLNYLDESCVCGGEAITIGLVCAVMCVSILCIVVWKFFVSNKGEVKLPGGFEFQWGALRNVVKR